MIICNPVNATWDRKNKKKKQHMWRRTESSGSSASYKLANEVFACLPFQSFASERRAFAGDFSTFTLFSSTFCSCFFFFINILSFLSCLFAHFSVAMHQIRTYVVLRVLQHRSKCHQIFHRLRSADGWIAVPQIRRQRDSLRGSFWYFGQNFW